MAWYLNEFLTDVDLLPRAVWRLKKYYSGTEFQRGSRAWRSFYRYLRDADINLSQLEHNYWFQYESNIFTYLATDMALLLRNLGLIEASGPIQLTDLGSELYEKRLSMEGTLGSGLLNWQMSDSVRPVYVLLVVLEKLDTPDFAPCPGLMLPEFIRVMRMLEQKSNADNCIKAIRDWRQVALKNHTPSQDAPDDEITRARRRICHHLDEEDGLTWQDIERGRTTQMVIISSGMAVYGGLFDRVQYMGSERSFLAMLRKKQPESYEDISQWLSSLPTPKVAGMVEEWLGDDE